MRLDTLPSMEEAAALDEILSSGGADAVCADLVSDRNASRSKNAIRAPFSGCRMLPILTDQV
jgi:hypothetical protein